MVNTTSSVEDRIQYKFNRNCDKRQIVVTVNEAKLLVNVLRVYAYRKSDAAKKEEHERKERQGDILSR